MNVPLIYFKFSGNKPVEDTDASPPSKLIKLTPMNCTETETSNYTQYKINLKNVTIFLHLVKR